MKEESLLLLSDLQKLINQVVLIDYTIIILGGGAMKYKFTKAEQETVINFDNELDTASIYTHDSRLIKKLRELRKQYPEQFILEHREHGSVTYTIPKRCVGIRPPYSEKRREQQRQEAKENGLPFMEKGEMNDGKN